MATFDSIGLRGWIPFAGMLALILGGFALSRARTRWSPDAGMTDSDRGRRDRVSALSFLYIVSFIAVNLAISRGWLANPPMVIAGVAAAALLGAGTVRAYIRWLKSADELVRKIQVDALALAFGLGFVGVMATGQLARAGVLPDADLWTVLLVMLGIYAVVRVAGYRRYR